MARKTKISLSVSAVGLALLTVVGYVLFATGVLGPADSAKAATKGLEEGANSIRSKFSDSLGNPFPIAVRMEIFRKDGYTAIADNEPVTHPENVVSQVIMTADSNGFLSSAEGTISSIDGTVLSRSASDDSGKLKYREPSSGKLWYNSGQPPIENVDLSEWLEARLALVLFLEERGYSYAGRGTFLGRPNVRYEKRQTVTVLPGGTVIDPWTTLTVVEMVEDNPLLTRDMIYNVLPDGELELARRNTVTEFAINPAQLPFQPLTPVPTPGPGSGSGSGSP